MYKTKPIIPDHEKSNDEKGANNSLMYAHESANYFVY